jgi:hypothetical protein
MISIRKCPRCGNTKSWFVTSPRIRTSKATFLAFVQSNPIHKDTPYSSHPPNCMAAINGVVLIIPDALESYSVEIQIRVLL